MVKKITFFVFVIACNFQNIYGQFVVGASEVDNAAQFEVVATNKGVLLPRVQLTGTNDVTTVSNVSIGSKESLLVYNTATVNDVIPGYYYWDKNKWVPLSGTDNQNLTLSGNNLSIEGGNSVSLSTLDTDDQTLSITGSNLSISEGNSVSLSGINTDNQNLTLSGNNLSIEGGNSVSLASLDTDNQTLSLSGTNLAIQDGNTVSLSGLLDNLGNHTASESLKMGTNEIQGAGNNTLINGVEVGQVGHGGSWLGLANSNSATSSGYALIQNDNGTTLLNAENGQKIGFRIANSEKMTMTSAGNLGIGVASPSAKFDLNGNARIRSITAGNTSDQVLTVDSSGNVRKLAMSTVGAQGDTDDQTLSISGTDLSIQDGNTVSLSGLLDDLGNHTATETLKMEGQRVVDAFSVTAGDETQGRATLLRGANGNTGFVEFRRPDNRRTGYVGNDGTNIRYHAEVGAEHYFTGGTLQVRNTRGSTNLMNFVSGGDGLAWGNRANDFGINFQTASSVQTGNLARISAGDVSSGSNTGNRYLGFQVGKDKQNSDTKLLYLSGNLDGTQRVGILNENPSATLDVNGNARIRSIATGTNNDQVLTVDANGNIRKVSAEKIGEKGDTDDQTLSFTGTTLGISEGNNVNLNSLKDNLGNHTATTTLQMSKQKIANVGHIEFAAGSGAREGYIGNDNNNMKYVAEQGAHLFQGGNVGVGIAPSFKLHVNGRTKLDGADAGTWIEAGATDWFLGRENANFRLWNNGNKLNLTPSGNLWNAGTTTIGNLATVSGSTYATVTENDGTLRKQTWESIKNWIINQVPSSADNLGNHNASTRLWMNGNEIQGAGSNTLINGVEVGQVGHGGSWLGLANKDQATTTGYALIQNNVGQTLLNTQSGQKIGFRVANAEKMTMTSNGNFGVGVTSPSAKLDVNGNARIRSIAGGATSDQVLTVDANGNVRKVAMSTVGGQGNTDNQTLSFSGTTLSINRGNSVNLNSLKDNLGNHSATTTLNLNRNKVANVDHIEFKKAGGDASREGYIGYNNTNMQYVAEQGDHLFKGGRVNIANLPGVSGSTYATVTENDGILRKQSWESIKNWIVNQVPSSADGDAWGVNGEDRTSSISRTGNVGIGGAPSFKLHVRGRAKLDGSDAGTWIEGGANDWFLGRNSADLRIYNNGDKVTFKPNGDVGIGTSTPASKLTVKDGNFRAISNQPNLFLDRNGSAVWRMYVSSGDSGIDPNDFVIRKQGSSPAFVINDQTGNIGIGVEKTQGHKLRALGSIRGTRFVSDTNNYPDYVFDHYYEGTSELNDKYNFPSLEEVERFTKENGHLPGVSSIKDIESEGGVDISRLGVQNLEKVEELYLHIIELNKTIKSLKEENKELNTKLNSEMTLMNERIDQLSKLVKKSSK